MQALVINKSHPPTPLPQTYFRQTLRQNGDFTGLLYSKESIGQAQAYGDGQESACVSDLHEAVGHKSPWDNRVVKKKTKKNLVI